MQAGLALRGSELVQSIYYTFSNEKGGEVELKYKVRPSGVGPRFFSAFKSIVDQGSTPREPKRFYGFLEPAQAKAEIAVRINQIIDKIHMEFPGLIEHRASADMDSQGTNHLHKYFEVHRGSVLNPGETFLKSSPAVKRAWEDFNVQVHMFEGFRPNSYGNERTRRVVWTWKNRPRFDLAPEDYSLFSLRREFGSLYLNYCEVGKQLTDIFDDDDRDVVGDENIRPLRFYSADAELYFGSPVTEAQVEKYLREMDQFWDEVGLDRLGFRKGDVRNAIGFLPVADLDMPGLSSGDILQMLANHQHQKSARYEDFNRGE